MELVKNLTTNEAQSTSAVAYKGKFARPSRYFLKVYGRIGWINAGRARGSRG